MRDFTPWEAQLGSPLDFELSSPALFGWNDNQPGFVESTFQTHPPHSGPSPGLTIYTHTRFEFLGRLTSRAGLNKIFNFVATTEISKNVWEGNATATSLVWDFSSTYNNSTRSEEGSTNSDLIELSRMMSWINHPLFPCSKSAWNTMERVQEVKKVLAAASDALPARDKSYVEFFNPANIEKFLNLYWNDFSFHCPIIHRPTFEPTKAPIMMILVMVLIGAHMSTSPNDSSSARAWMDIAEEEVFAHPSLNGATQDAFDGDSGDSEVSLRERLGALQSAFLLCVLQTWEGSNDAKTRIRSHQYPKVITAARNFGFARGRHTNDIDLNNNYINWSEYLFKEEIIRTLTHVFLLDNKFTLFNSMAPQIATSELAMSPTCPEVLFQATNPSDLLMTLRQFRPADEAIRNTSIRDLVGVICSEQETGGTSMNLAGLTTLNLFVLITAIQTVIYSQSMSFFLFPSAISALRTVLETWLQAWRSRLEEKSNQFMNDGTSASIESSDNAVRSFVRHAPEFQTLASLMLDKLSDISNRSNEGEKLALPPERSWLGDISDLISAAQANRSIPL
ncbi:hypothetical protein DL98DRAFT_578517 [Cadophora sp. DSE1049]|nr:hypothetical protein DL98DRAFT_578517 [Cadophora sp. DSE1049]